MTDESWRDYDEPFDDADELDEVVSTTTGTTGTMYDEEYDECGTAHYEYDEEYDEYDDEHRLENDYDDERDPFRDDVEADADVLRSCGWGTDEDYGYYGEDEPFGEEF